MKPKKHKYKKIHEGRSSCTCCELSYWQSSVLNGLTIVLEKKEKHPDIDGDNTIDIPLRELPNLNRIINQILRENKHANSKKASRKLRKRN